MFSYFLMKGMEGDADKNADNKITAQELHNYVKENVTQQSSGSQTPELQGDKDRVLVVQHFVLRIRVVHYFIFFILFILASNSFMASSAVLFKGNFLRFKMGYSVKL